MKQMPRRRGHPTRLGRCLTQGARRNERSRKDATGLVARIRRGPSRPQPEKSARSTGWMRKSGN